MSELITVRGFVATEVREDKTHNGHAVSSFRLGATERRYIRETNSWEDGETNWFTVACFRSLAKNVAFSVLKGERVIVTGRLKIRNWSMPDGRSGTTADIDAETVGHDLLLGVTKFKRSAATPTEPLTESGEPAGEQDSDIPGLDRSTGELLEEMADGGFETSGGDSTPATELDEEEKDRDQHLAA